MIVEKKIENSMLDVTLAVERDAFDKARMRAYMDNVDHYPVPGKASGLAELPDLVKTYGPAVLYDEALGLLIPETFGAFLKEENLRIFGKPQVSDMQFGEDGGVRFQVKADLFPDAKVGEYKNIAVPYVRMGQQKEFEQAVVQKACEGMEAEIPVSLIEQKLNAIEAQEKLSIHNDAVYHLLSDMLVILDEAYVAAGAFRPKVQVRREAMDLMLEAASAEHEMDWREFLKEQIMVMAERYHSLPEDCAQKWDAIMEKRAKKRQKMSPEELTEDLFKAYLGSLELTEEQWKNQRREQAVREVRTDLLLSAVAEKEKIEVGSDEYHAAIEELASSYGIEPEEAAANIDRDAFTGKLRRDKALALILNSAVTDYKAKEELDRKIAEARAGIDKEVQIISAEEASAGSEGGEA